jgi:hypothetical protein
VLAVVGGQAVTESQPSNYLISFRVYGTPGPQGSKTPTGATRITRDGRRTPVLRESSRKVKPWRRDVAEAAAAELSTHTHRAWFPLDGPLVARMVFTVKAPATKRADETPNAADRTPDLSKLARSTEDALTGILWTDDARIIGYDWLWKTYPLIGDEALAAPGAHISVRRATHQELHLDPDSRAGRKYTTLLAQWETVTAASRRAALIKEITG